jgi:hypothetical protein
MAFARNPLGGTALPSLGTKLSVEIAVRFVKGREKE